MTTDKESIQTIREAINGLACEIDASPHMIKGNAVVIVHLSASSYKELSAAWSKIVDATQLLTQKCRQVKHNGNSVWRLVDGDNEYRMGLYWRSSEFTVADVLIGKADGIQKSWRD